MHGIHSFTTFFCFLFSMNGPTVDATQTQTGEARKRRKKGKHEESEVGKSHRAARISLLANTYGNNKHHQASLFFSLYLLHAPAKKKTSSLIPMPMLYFLFTCSPCFSCLYPFFVCCCCSCCCRWCMFFNLWLYWSMGTVYSKQHIMYLSVSAWTLLSKGEAACLPSIVTPPSFSPSLSLPFPFTLAIEAW